MDQVIDQADAVVAPDESPAARPAAPPVTPPVVTPGGPARRVAARIAQPGIMHRRAVFVWGFCGATIAVIWLVFAFYAAHERSRIFDLAGRELLGAQNVLRAHARRTYESTLTMLAVIDHWLAASSAGQPGGPRPIAELEALIATLQSHGEGPLAIRLIDSDNMMSRLGPPGSENVVMDVSDRPYIQNLRDAAPGTMEIGATIRRGAVSYVLPIVIKTHPNSFGIAYILAGETMETFSGAYENLLVTAPATLGIIENNGTILFTWPENVEITGQVVPGFSDYLGNRPAGERALIELPSIDGSGDGTLTGYASTVMAPLVVFASFERRDLDRVWLGNIAVGFLVCLGMSAAVALFAATVGRMMRRDAFKTLALQDALMQARDADRAKKNFLASMSHELRTPLNAIIGFSDMMRAETFGPLGAPRYKEYAADISDAGRHLLDVIHDILDTARIEHGFIELGTSPIKVEEAIEQTLQIMRPVVSERGLAISRAIDAGLPPLAMGKAHLQQVLFNIVGNAVKFSPPGAAIRIAAKVVPGVVPGVMPGAIEIIVADQGGGIPAHRIGELFRPFSKIDDGYVRNSEGIGLGLANSKLIVEAYGGRIALESELGKGTRVRISLPVTRPKPDQKPDQKPDRGPDREPDRASAGA
jgi:signal transduction histidine kinase